MLVFGKFCVRTKRMIPYDKIDLGFSVVVKEY